MKYSSWVFSALVLFALCTSVSAEDTCLSYLPDMDFMEYVSCYNYPVESYIVVTDDEYELMVFRIQAKNTSIVSGKPVTLMWHGLMDACNSWVANEEQIAPALILANEGYDVWLANSRGARYSMGHKKYNPKSSEAYWDFSWQEMSDHDVPAVFEFIANKTGMKINYVGHSQGTAQMFAALSNPRGRNEKITKNLLKFAALGPAAYVNHAESPIFVTLAKSSIALSAFKYFGKYGMFLPGWTSTKSVKFVCMNWKWMCSKSIENLSDRDPSVDNIERMNVFGSHYPASTSFRNVLHWKQSIISGNFSMFDFGPAENMKRYGQETAPEYDLSLIKEKVAMFVGSDDLLANPTDAKRLFDNMINAESKTYHEYQRVGHLTFLLGRELAYMNDLLEFLRN
mmetsp:Transcript_64761/g.75299  ORF Transcript_64761/g.75299 Transcript_64761/m.75299 type:complete len:397 (+) Transcript_64761:27-1217(+)